MNKEIKSSLRRKNRLYRKYISVAKKQENEVNLRQNTGFVSNLIATTKDYNFSNLSKRLNDPMTDPKTYLSILKRFLNKIKIAAILPLVNGTFETDFGKNAVIFNFAFTKQCNILNNGSFIPELDYKTYKRIANIIFSSSDLSRIIKDLNPNKAHNYHNISIRIIKLCGDSLLPQLKSIFKSATTSGHFPSSWKKGNIIPVHKKKSKNLLTNYRPISLLPVFGKIFEKVIYNNCCFFFKKINFFRTINLASGVETTVFLN